MVFKIKKFKEYDREVRNIIIIYGISIIYWITLVFYREYFNRDIKLLRKNVVLNCNGWCLSHFFNYLALGYCAPSYIIELIIIGIIFELIEIPLNSISKYIDSKLIEDTFVNTLGILMGALIYKLYPKKIDLYQIIFYS